MESILDIKPLTDAFFSEVEKLHTIIANQGEQIAQQKQEIATLTSTLIKYEYALDKCRDLMRQYGDGVAQPQPPPVIDPDIPETTQSATPPPPPPSPPPKPEQSDEQSEQSEKPEKPEEEATNPIKRPTADLDAEERRRRQRERKAYMREYHREYRKAKRQNETDPVEMNA